MISLLRNVRYHEDRQSHYAAWNRAFDMFVLITGLGTVAALTSSAMEGMPSYVREHGAFLAGGIGAGASIIGAIQLVFSLARQEHIHDDLRRKFLALLCDLDETNVDDIGRRAKRLIAEEPPTFHAVDALAYNFAARSQDRPKGTLLVIRFWHRLLRHFFRFEGKEFRRRSDRGWW